MIVQRGRRPWILGAAAVIIAALAACGDDPPSVAELLAEACTDAREGFAAAPAPTSTAAEAAFLDASYDATQAVAKVAGDVAVRGDDKTIADLAWQLYQFPAASDADAALGVAQKASAAIMRIDRFSQVLQVPECGAAAWRPADWRAMAARHADRPGEAGFRRQINRLCAVTFPEPPLLARGVPLLDALVADAAARGRPSEDVKARVIARLNTVTTRPSAAARFISDFSDELPRIRPSANLDGEYLALLAAFMRLESAVPSGMPDDPPPAVRERLDVALSGLQDAWEALGITCRGESSD